MKWKSKWWIKRTDEYKSKEKLKNILIKERISHDEIINDLHIKHTETDVAMDIAINKLKEQLKTCTEMNDKIIYELNNVVKEKALEMNKIKNANEILINNINSITKLMQNEIQSIYNNVSKQFSEMLCVENKTTDQKIETNANIETKTETINGNENESECNEIHSQINILWHSLD